MSSIMSSYVPEGLKRSETERPGFLNEEIPVRFVPDTPTTATGKPTTVEVTLGLTKTKFVKFDGNTDEEFLRMLVAHEKYEATAGNIKGAKKAAAKAEKLDMIAIKSVEQAKDLRMHQKKYEKLVADAFKMYGDMQGTKLSQLWEAAVQEVCVQPRDTGVDGATYIPRQTVETTT